MLGLLRDVVLLNNNQQRRPTGFPELLTTQQQTGGDTNSNTDGFSGTSTQSSQTLSYTTDDHHDGAGCIKLNNDYNGPNTLYMWVGGTDYTNVTVGESYTAKAWQKCSNVVTLGSRIAIKWFNSSKVLIGTTNATTVNSPTSWTEFEVSGVAPSNAVYAQPMLQYGAGALNRYMYGDSFSFKRS